MSDWASVSMKMARSALMTSTTICASDSKVAQATIVGQDEEILDFATGDREFWIINGAHNLCYVHPAQTGIRSDLHLITSSGRVYSFLLTEISNEAGAEPDLKLFVEPKEQSSIAVGIAPQGFVPDYDNHHLPSDL